MPSESEYRSMMKLKMYILIKESVPVGLGVNAVGHTSLATFMRFKDDPVTQAWVTGKHFRKVTCVVSDAEFEEAKQYADHVIMTENAIGDAEVGIGFKPREEWPQFFKKLRLFGTHLETKRDYSWVKVDKFVDDVNAPLMDRFERLLKHHRAETEFLLAHIDELTHSL